MPAQTTTYSTKATLTSTNLIYQDKDHPPKPLKII